MLKRLQATLFTPIDIAPLVFFRVAFGGLMLWEVWRYFYYDRIARYYVEPSYTFHYFGFEWVKPLAGDGMFVLFHILGLLSVLIMLGAFYRVSMALFWLCFSYVFLLDQAQYLNHFYLVSLVSLLLIFIPAHRTFSVDALLRPALRSQVAPAWALWLLRGQMAVVYIFGGVAKINPDWLAGEPMRQWMSERTDFPIIGTLFTQEWLVYLFSYGGLLLDLLVVPLLLWKRTRIPALIVATAFHLTNSQLFNIGIFPWFAIAATLLFLEPERFRPTPLRRFLPPTPALPSFPKHQRWIVAGIGVYFAVQIALPVRHWFYPGDPSWTEEGHTLAWHMRLRSKDADIAFYASDPTSGTSWQIPAEEYLSTRQFEQMRDNPHMILRFAHHLARTLQPDTPAVKIHAWAMVSLNSRTPQLMIDPTVDLASEPDNLLASDWILPLVQQPYPAPAVPALLISRRDEQSLKIVNITRSIIPLDGLVIQAGGEQINGLDFGVSELLPDECLMAYTAEADLQVAFTPCNETGTRVTLPTAFVTAPLHITIGTQSHTCDSQTCVIALH